ncbi:MAG TPA: extracellular solute-binding protein [Armatimonadota bacterium]|jgi:multiple sugar transport system permease protein
MLLPARLRPRAFLRRVGRAAMPALALCAATLTLPARAETTLRFRYWGDIKELNIVREQVRRFEAAHPGVHVSAERAPAGTAYVQKVLVEFAGGTPPDVLFVETNMFVTLADKGVLMPLNPLMKGDSSFHIGDYYPEIVDRFTVRDRASGANTIYTIPRDIAPVCCIYYNKKLFDDAGVPYPSDDWTWSDDPGRLTRPGFDPNKDFLSVCERLTKRNPKTGHINQFAIDAVPDPFIYSAGGRLADSVKKPTRVTYDDPNTLHGLQFRADLINKYHVMPSPMDYSAMGVGAPDLFLTGRLAMFHSGIWNTPQFRDIKTFDWDVAMFPKGPTGIRAFGTGGSGYGIARGSRHALLAWELVKYLAGPDGQIALAKTGLAQPAIRRLAESSAWLDGQKPTNKVITCRGVPYIQFNPFTPVWDEVMTKINPELDLVWEGKQSAAQAVRKTLPAAQRVLDEWRFPKTLRAFPWVGGVIAFFAILAAIVFGVWWASRAEWAGMKSRHKRKDAWAGYVFIAPWIVGFVVFTIGPIVASFMLAFCQWDLINPAKWVGMGNFTQILGHDDLFSKTLWNTVVFTVFSVPLGVAGSLAVAMLLNAKVKGQAWFRTAYYLPAVTSAVAASVLWMWVFNPDFGLLNTAIDKLHLMPLANLLHLVDPDKHKILWLLDERLAKPSLILMGLWGVGGGMVIFLAGLQGIPAALYEAAELDGAGALSRFRNVTLPMLTPTIFFTLIMGVIGSFQVFTQAFVMTAGGPHNATLFYVLYLYQNAFQFLKMGYASALAWILFAFILVATLIQFRFSGWVYYESGGNQ